MHAASHSQRLMEALTPRIPTSRGKHARSAKNLHVTSPAATSATIMILCRNEAYVRCVASVPTWKSINARAGSIIEALCFYKPPTIMVSCIRNNQICVMRGHRGMQELRTPRTSSTTSYCHCYISESSLTTPRGKTNNSHRSSHFDVET